MNELERIEVISAIAGVIVIIYFMWRVINQ